MLPLTLPVALGGAQLVSSCIQWAGAASISILAASCGVNMLQTYHLIHDKTSTVSKAPTDRALSSGVSSGRLSNIGVTTPEWNPDLKTEWNWESATPVGEVVRELQGMKREELIRLFQLSPAPALQDLCAAGKQEQEWEGVLLDNNGFLMTFVTKVITNRLFSGALSGRRTWVGKSFGRTHQAQTTHVTEGQFARSGINRFRVEPSAKMPQSQKEQHQKPKTLYNHQFQYQLGPSKLSPKDNQKQALVLRYNHYHPFGLSLWNSMVDELKLVHVSEKGAYVLLGMGSMTWSGAHWNCSPFCLYSPSSKSALCIKDSTSIDETNQLDPKHSNG